MLAFLLLPLLARAAVIVPGATWTDTSGNAIQAHGGGFLKSLYDSIHPSVFMLQVGSTYYWFGEDKSHNSGLLLYGANVSLGLSAPINSHKSSDLIDRQNSEYVMWFHSDTSNYGAAEVGVATAKTPCGPYTYKSSFKPLGADSRDMSLFQDAAQTAYLLYASDNNQNFKISKLDSNYYNVTSQVSVLTVADVPLGSTLEAPGMIKRSGASQPFATLFVVYYLFASHTSGWDPNPNKFFTASTLAGPWSSQADIAPEPVRTYFSQNAFDMFIQSSFTIYMGDRWRPSLLGSSTYIWYPLSWSSGVPQIVPADVWSLNLQAGTYTVASGTTYEAEKGTISGSATLLSDSSFSGGKAVGYLGKGGSVSITVQGTGVAQWVSLYYANGDSAWRNTTVSVNGGSNILVDQPNTGGGHVILSVPVKLTLRSGSNTLVFSANQNTYAADLDKIIVYSAT
ncbi:LOW QUALITY PROTEIN: hypothetical protein CVT26_002708 [Gymnopilus dilepis]|uniref:CBM6 domain-containing protein n=1 Tax=Gymnopilus dilepis TaxID=231916 RepID=A0A409VCF1_9AGAR|nr:LOW QUALITY PROTEIN: hypothetical protein CVT26_002708 [Gymnopilus dilepis]